MTLRQQRTFIPEFNQQLVKLYENRKFYLDIAKESDITLSALRHLIKNHKETRSFKACNNLSEYENKLHEQ